MEPQCESKIFIFIWQKKLYIKKLTHAFDLLYKTKALRYQNGNTYFISHYLSIVAFDFSVKKYFVNAKKLSIDFGLD